MRAGKKSVSDTGSEDEDRREGMWIGPGGLDLESEDTTKAVTGKQSTERIGRGHD